MTIIADAYRELSTRRFPLPTESQLEELERRIGVTLPDDYRRFILDFNGGHFKEPWITPIVEGCPEDGLRYLHGIGASHPHAELARPRDLALFDDNDPPKIVPIGHTCMGGLIILVIEEERRGEILLKQAFGDFFFLAEGIEEFFELLEEDQSEADG